MTSDLEKRLGRALLSHPAEHNYRFDDSAKNDFLELLYRSMTGWNDEYLRVLFPRGPPSGAWSLSDEQGIEEGAEYSEAARGKRCGHIYQAGESSYKCSTCSTDDTTALCVRCFEASDHTGHNYEVSISSGGTGCCDCGDDEAFRLPVFCGIHTDTRKKEEKAKERESLVAPGLRESIRITIAKMCDFFCDVISCAPEQLRREKTEENVREDERQSRLSADWYNGADQDLGDDTEYVLVLWNDEKHTLHEVKNQLARSCRERERFGLTKANETNDFGRSLIKYSKDLGNLLRIAQIIEQIKITVSIRSSRDTYREQMCGVVVEWLNDIAQCTVGKDNDLLQLMICEQLLQSWRIGSPAANAGIGLQGLYDHDLEEHKMTLFPFGLIARHPLFIATGPDNNNDDDNDDEDNDIEMDEEFDETNDDEEDVEFGDQGVNISIEDLVAAAAEGAGLQFNHDGNVGEDDAATDETHWPAQDQNGEDDRPNEAAQSQDQVQNASSQQSETDQSHSNRSSATFHDAQEHPDDRMETGTDTREQEQFPSQGEKSSSEVHIPSTPGADRRVRTKAPSYWDTPPNQSFDRASIPPYEDLRRRTRLDWFILFDLRLWRTVRYAIRDLFISTVVKIPEFKRILGLRFAALYPALVQLFLIADREPECSIINLSLQLVSTPSIADELVERGNFLTKLLAVFYTFLTTRQVGEPQEVNPSATISIDNHFGTSRRLLHFFNDFKHIMHASEHVKNVVQSDARYLLQFLDLVKLPQGICPNERAVTQHVEFEADSWIGASILMKEINYCSKVLGDCFRVTSPEDLCHLCTAMTATATAAMVNSAGLEKSRFTSAEIKDFVRFKTIPYGEFEIDETEEIGRHRVVDYVVESGRLSFHHPLHYLLSYLFEFGRELPSETLNTALRRAATATVESYKIKTGRQDLSIEDALLAMFDFPLRVNAWMAQMKVGLWVRNGLGLKHQMVQYRSVHNRDYGFYRDIFLVQTALVVCDPTRVLASIADRFGVTEWFKKQYAARPDYDEDRRVDMLEEFVYFLIVLLVERTSLIFGENDEEIEKAVLRREIVHILCFKPLTFSELTTRMQMRLTESDHFEKVLGEVANFRPPEGVNDSASFQLKEEYIPLIEPYYVQYNKNNRDDAENIYKNWKAKQTGQKPNDIVFEPRPLPIPRGAYTGLTKFTKTPLFAQLIHQCLEYCLVYCDYNHTIKTTRIESLLQVILHLMILGALDDADASDTTVPPASSFTKHALTKIRTTPSGPITTIGLLEKIAHVNEFETCASKIQYLLKMFHQRQPELYDKTMENTNFPYKPVDMSRNDRETKRQMARERQAKVMAQFQKAQQSFLDTQEGDSETNVEGAGGGETVDDTATETKTWKFPAGSCILCQEETNDHRVYGSFGFFQLSRILRKSPFEDTAYNKELAQVPTSLDRSAENIRPFGVAGDNIENVRKLGSHGEEIIAQRRGISYGFPTDAPPLSHRSEYAVQGPVMVGCGHLMHYSCFETYHSSIQRRHDLQIARHHPEQLENLEFVCPLCKALNNSFLPIVFNPKEESYPGALNIRDNYDEFLTSQLPFIFSKHRNNESSASTGVEEGVITFSKFDDFFRNYISNNFISTLTNSLKGSMSSDVQEGISSESVPAHQRPIQVRNPRVIPNSFIEALSGQLQTNSLEDILEVFRRLSRTLRSEHFKTLVDRVDYPLNDERIRLDCLISSFGLSISAAEVAQRGIEPELGATLISTIPHHTLSNLRLLAEMPQAFVSLEFARSGRESLVVKVFEEIIRWKFCQLFMGHPNFPYTDKDFWTEPSVPPLLGVDTFVFLSECSLSILPAMDLDPMHVVRLCYIAEIVKVTLTYFLLPEISRDLGGLDESDEQPPDSEPSSAVPLDKSLPNYRELFNVLAFANFVTNAFHAPYEKQMIGISVPQSSDKAASFLSNLRFLIERYTLPFLRKTLILLNSRFGVEFPGFSNPELPELERLTTMLRLPSLDEIFLELSNPKQESITRPLVEGWLSHYGCRSTPPYLLYPGIYELIGLPENYEVFLGEAAKHRCPTTGKHMTDPSICLFCGEMFCGQAVCCSDGALGGCNQHKLKCGGSVGLFINIRRCIVLFLYNGIGSWFNAPYLDEHGETDFGYKHRRRLILNQKRYDRLLRDVWLAHGIPSVIARKLEGDVNNGGWESL